MQIKVTPEELRDAACFLKVKEEALRAEAKSLKSKIDSVAANWEGASKSSFIEEFEREAYPVMSVKLPQIVDGITNQLIAAADIMEDADSTLANAFSMK